MDGVYMAYGLLLRGYFHENEFSGNKTFSVCESVWSEGYFWIHFSVHHLLSVVWRRFIYNNILCANKVLVGMFYFWFAIDGNGTWKINFLFSGKCQLKWFQSNQLIYIEISGPIQWFYFCFDTTNQYINFIPKNFFKKKPVNK